MDTKLCKICAEEKPIGEFYKNRHRCKKCLAERSTQWAKDNPDKCKEIQRRSRKKRHSQRLEYQRVYRKRNPEKIKLENSLRGRYRDKIRKSQNEYHRKRRASDPCFRIAHNLRTRVYDVLRGRKKSWSAIKSLGCSPEFLKEYLESKFQEGMTWENYGEWHVDHIIPLSSFDLSKKDQFQKASHYTNLQPLWAIDNLRKNKQLPHELNHSECDDSVSRGAIDAA